MLGSHGSRGSAALAACAAILLVLSGCAAEKKAEEAPTQPVRLYGTDGNMHNSFAGAFKDRVGLIDGMKGTTPLTPLSEDFKARIRSVDPKLRDFLYAGESYDAVVIAALAAQLAGTTRPAEIAAQINGVSNQGRRCDRVAVCLQLARSGTDIEYRGVSLTRAGFTDVGEPATASYATMHFDNGKINDSKTEFVGAGDESAASTKSPPKGRKAKSGKSDRSDGSPLKLGGLLSKTGDLSLAYPPKAAGIALALRDINEAGGVLGEPVVWIDGDDGTNPTIAKATVARHVAAGVHVIIGANGSGTSREILPDVVAAGLVLFAPSNTAAGLTTIDDQGLYFRTAPSDILQGRALADVILRDGPHRIAVVARKDSYGEGLQANVRAELERAGIPMDRIKLLTYDPPANASAPPVDFSAGAREIKAFGADAVLVIGFSESVQVITALADAGVEIRR